VAPGLESHSNEGEFVEETLHVGVESTAHLIEGCSFPAGFWRQIGVELEEEEIDCLWDVQPLMHILTLHFNIFFASLLLAYVET
jgi:hypothetical protein